MQTKVKELMKRNPVIIPPESNLKEVAQKMQLLDCGVLPVGSWEKPEGIITDRDIVIRAVAEGVDLTEAKVREYMTDTIFYCNENDTLEEAAKQMCQHNVSRLLIKDQNGKACGIITFGAIMRKNNDLQELSKVVECALGKNAA